jgi:hypothetical protein
VGFPGLARILGFAIGNRQKSLAGDLSSVQGGCGEIARVLADCPDLTFALRGLLQARRDTATELLEMLARGVRDETAEDEKYRIAETLTSAVYPKYKFSEYARLFLEDEKFLAYYARFMDCGNWHSLDRKYTLDQLLKLTLHVAGDAAECGVYKGASAYLICRALQPYAKWTYLFDSFEGLSVPIKRDGTYWSPGVFRIDESYVRENLGRFQNFTVYRGWIPDRFEEVAGRRFSFVHVDVDLYEPTRQSIEFFYDRLNPGGVMLLDDYGFKTCPGAKVAADEFFANKPERIVGLPTGQAFILRRTEDSRT